MPEVRALNCDSESEDTYAAIDVEKVASVSRLRFLLLHASEFAAKRLKYPT